WPIEPHELAHEQAAERGDAQDQQHRRAARSSVICVRALASTSSARAICPEGEGGREVGMFVFRMAARPHALAAGERPGCWVVATGGAASDVCRGVGLVRRCTGWFRTRVGSGVGLRRRALVPFGRALAAAWVCAAAHWFLLAARWRGGGSASP